jgi:hypothetical protein
MLYLLDFGKSAASIHHKTGFGVATISCLLVCAPRPGPSPSDQLKMPSRSKTHTNTDLSHDLSCKDG